MNHSHMCHPRLPITKAAFSGLLIVLSVVVSTYGQLGDFDGNGIWDCDDIDTLTAATFTGTDPAFDLNSDGVVDLSDRDEWLAIAGTQNLDTGQPYPSGDFNLNGVVDVSDFMIWNNNKLTLNSNWCSGDHNTDGAVDVSDFNLWNENKFTVAGYPNSSTFDPSPIDDAVDFIYHAETGLMTMDTNGLDIWCMSVYGAEPIEFLLNGATGTPDPDDAFWVQDFFLGHSKWFSTDISPAADNLDIALFESGLTSDDFDYVTFGRPDGTMGRGTVTIVTAETAVSVVPEPDSVWFVLPVFCFVLQILKNRR